MFAIAGVLGVGGAGIGALATPALAPVLVPVAALIGAAAVCGFVGTERERALLDARRRAEQASEAKTRLLAMVSHEFRTPLNGILGLTGLLLESKLAPDQETYARAVRSSGESLLHLVDEMLDFSCIEAGRFDLRPAPTNINVLLREVGELLAAPAHAKALDMAVDAGADLPWRVLVDAPRLRQVLINLVDNAIKFTDEGGVVLRAKRQSGPPDGRVRIAFSVEDTGPGIDASEIERIFGEFEQLENRPEQRDAGAGLGLAISRRIVRRLGSELEFNPRPSGGAQFSFTLELMVDEEGRGAPEERLTGLNALIVSPGATEPEVLAAWLGGAGAAVATACDVDEAIARLAGTVDSEEPSFDMLLMDHRVGTNPVNALHRLRAVANRPLPAVILMEPDKRGALPTLRAAGFDAYLIRPVRRCSLIRIVADVVSSPGLFRADPDDSARDAATLDILLAEDNEINALLVRSILESLGHRVTEVRDGTSAVDAATKQDKSFAAILMDLQMPGLDGIAASSIIRNFEMKTARPRAKILLLTANVLAETRSRAAEAGVDAVIEKPIASELLRRELSNVRRGESGSTVQVVEPAAG